MIASAAPQEEISPIEQRAAETARANLTFEERTEEILHYINKRQKVFPKIGGMQWDDIRQLVLIRIFNQFATFDATRGDFRNWLNRVISRTLSNIWRDNVGRYLRPCIKGKLGCEHNCGGDLCGKTPSGLQCAECPLFRRWEQGVGIKYRLRFPGGLLATNEDGETNERTDVVPDTSAQESHAAFNVEAARAAIARLPECDREKINAMLAAGIIGNQRNSANYDLLHAIRPQLRQWYSDEINERRPERLKFMTENKFTIKIQNDVPLPPRTPPRARNTLSIR